MGIRGILFCLSLYIALVWVVVLLVFAQDGEAVIFRMGLLWTAVGLIAVLLWLVAQQILGWWRLRKARTPPKLVQQERAILTADEDQVAFAALLAEADRKLARAADGLTRRIGDFPIYLVLGPEAAGKTSLLDRAGIDARLLAGQLSGAGSGSGARAGNIWLANDCIFLEVSGRLFQGDAGKLGEFLSVLRPDREANKGWHAFWRPEARTLQIRGAILCWDLRSFLGTPDRASMERSSNSVRERLFKISEVFGIRCPVYAIFTRADAIPFFSEFVDRMPEAEANQAFGCLTGLADRSGKVEDGVWADVENKRLSREFTGLFLCLSTRRLITLSQEPLADRKPAIYEFPREFKRLRGPVVQFLVDSLRPDPLGLSPALRGFFFCGSRQVASPAGGQPDTNAGVKADRGTGEATGIFRAEATQIFAGPLLQARRGELVDRPVFSRDFFQLVLRNDRPAVPVVSTGDAGADRKRWIAVGAIVALAGLLSILWTVSWLLNRGMVNDVQTSLAASEIRSRDLSLESLRGLEGLRHLLVDKLDQPRPLSMNWGLYTGFKLQGDVQRAYFIRLGQLVIKDANAYLLDSLRRLDRPENSEPYDTVYRRLKTQITIAKSGCAVDVPLVTETLNQVIGEAKRDLDEPRKDLVRRQIDYYVAALQQGTPIPLATDSEAINHARTYLSNSRGPQQVYAAILDSVRKDAKNVLVIDQVNNFQPVMTAPDHVDFEFTKEGSDKFKKLADSGKFNLTEDACVSGTQGLGEKAGILDQVRQAKGIYFRRYAETWAKFLRETNVRGYRDMDDATEKLNLLSGPNSPLLGLVKFAGDNTYFPALKLAPDDSLVGNVANRIGLGALKKKEEKAVAQVNAARKPAFGAEDVSRLFQPVHLTVQPDGKILVTEKNKDYVVGLRKLQESFEKYKNASATDRPPLIGRIQEAYLQAKSAERSLADGFDQDTDGVDVRLNEVLLQPIENARRIIPQPVSVGDEHKRHADLESMCLAVKPLLGKYPFNRSAAAELGLPDLTGVFAPHSGKIWAYEAASLGDLLVQKGTRWELKPDAPKPPIKPEVLEFLNWAQSITDAFFAGGASQPVLHYSLRPITAQTARVKLTIDGTVLNSRESQLQKAFVWPAANPGDSGAKGEVLQTGDERFGFGEYQGTWGVFHLFQYADDRAPGERTVTWSKTSGMGGAIPQSFAPVVKVEILDLPGGADVFNPRFLTPAKCPSQAIAPQ